MDITRGFLRLPGFAGTPLRHASPFPVRLVSAFSRLEASCGFVGDPESGVEGWNKEEVSGGNPTTESIHDQETRCRAAFDPCTAVRSWSDELVPTSRGCPRDVQLPLRPEFDWRNVLLALVLKRVGLRPDCFHTKRRPPNGAAFLCPAGLACVEAVSGIRGLGSERGASDTQ